MNYILYKKKKNFWCEFPLHAVEVNDRETFFGYYDKSPLNKNGDRLIFHATTHPTWKLPDTRKPISVYLYDFENRRVHGKYSSHAYNWQQGARCQWIDDTRFIFNDYDREQNIFVSRIVNGDTGVLEKTLDSPIYDVHGNSALTLNFERLNIYSQDYAYRQKSRGIPSDSEDGIFLLDLTTNGLSLICSFQQIADAARAVEGIDYDFHELNHIMIGPSGKQFIVLYRFYKNGVKTDKLIKAEISGRNIQVLNPESTMVSHCCWKDDDHVIAYMSNPKFGRRYLTVDVRQDKKAPLGSEVIDHFGDGHPSVSGHWMVFDTYPNKARLKELLLFNLSQEKLIKAGEFLEPLRYDGQCRCDLHPRWSSDGKYIFFDTVHTGSRRLNFIKFDHGRNSKD